VSGVSDGAGSIQIGKRLNNMSSTDFLFILRVDATMVCVLIRKPSDPNSDMCLLRDAPHAAVSIPRPHTRERCPRKTSVPSQRVLLKAVEAVFEDGVTVHVAQFA
jgi:hypothetical protein